MTRESDRTIRRGSGNVFADLGRPDPDTHLLKAQLVNRMHEILRDRKLTQTQAAHTIGIASRIFPGC